MESNPADSPIEPELRPQTMTEEAAHQLQQQQEVRDSVQEHGPSRGFAWYQLWSGIMAAAYIGVFLFAFSAGVGTAEDSNPGNMSQTSLLIVPILAFSVLTTGARERFGIRTALPRSVWIPLVAALLGMFSLAGLSVFDVPYPRFLIALVTLTVLVPLAVPAIAQLIRAPQPRNRADRDYAPLSKPVRWNTVIMGTVAGLLIAFDNILIVSMLVMIAALAGIMLSFVLTESRWILPQVGFEWGWPQWTAFGIATSTLFVFSALNPHLHALSPAATVPSAILVFLVMLVASALPAPRDARS
ncbi:hypothetical protein AB0O95_09145 [Rhodoglobus sp. NPDC076762]